jgi:hypothetical protein
MSIASDHRRLDDVEIYLSPKEWTIQLTQQMRLYPNEEDFLTAITKENYRECLFIKPVSKLEQQAHALYPDKSDISQRIELSQKLRTEFQELKIFICKLNGITEGMTGSIVLAAGFQGSRLENLLQEDRFCRVTKAAATWIGRTESKGKAEFILRMLRSFAYPPNSASQIESVSNDLVKLLKNILALEAGVQLAQDRYFDGYPILFRNIEEILKESIKFTTSTVERFNEFLSIHERAHLRDIQTRSGCIDVEAIMKSAKEIANLDMLGVHGAYRSEIFRAQREDELKAAMDVSRATRHKRRSTG